MTIRIITMMMTRRGGIGEEERELKENNNYKMGIQLPHEQRTLVPDLESR